MSRHVDRRSRPAHAAGTSCEQGLVDLMYEGFYGLFLLEHGCDAHDQHVFTEHMRSFLREVERKARQLEIPHEDLAEARYAFCAAIDETVLRASTAAAKGWRAKPMQLHTFGDQLAGEHFFDKLEALRRAGAARVQVLEVFHMCLLLGFRGRYGADDERLTTTCTRVGEEIARIRGKQRSFAPHGERPDQVSNRLHSDLSLWVLSCVFALAALGAYIGFRTTLTRHTQSTLAAYNDLVKLPPHAATVTITLP